MVDLDFPLILSWAVIISGVIWAADHWLLRPRRLAAADGLPAGTSNERMDQVLAEPVAVEYARSFFPVLLLVLCLRSFLFEPYQIPSGSMIPTLAVGDFILVNKYTYGIRLPVFNTKIVDVNDPVGGDVMVFVPPHESKYFIKRVIGTGGDEVVMDGRRVSVSGETLPQALVRKFPPPRPNQLGWLQFRETRDGRDYDILYFASGRHPRSGKLYPTRTWETCLMAEQKCEETNSWSVPDGHYFMMGDNRDNSGDSRVWGFVDDGSVVGRAVAVWIHKDPGWHLPTFARNRWIE